MVPYRLNSLSGRQISGDEAETPQSFGQDSSLYPSQESASQYQSTAPPLPPPYPVHDGHNSFPAPLVPSLHSSPSFSPLLLGDGFGGTPSSDHRSYNADHESAQHHGWDRHPLPTVPTSSHTVIPYNASNGDRSPTRSHNSSQSGRAAKRFAPVPLVGSSQAEAAGSDADERVPSLICGLPLPVQIYSSLHRTPLPAEPTPVDPSDIEYAQYRYGDKRCFYRCRFDVSGSPCNRWIVGERTRVLRHLRNHHHLQMGPAVPAVCCWDKCTHSRPMKQENLSRHVVMHLGVKWKCPHCGRLFSRDDAVHRHIERMAPGMDVNEAEVVPGREARTISDLQFRRTRSA